MNVESARYPLWALILVVLIMGDATKTTAQTQFGEIYKEQGLRAALDWRDVLFKD